MISLKKLENGIFCNFFKIFQKHSNIHTANFHVLCAIIMFILQNEIMINNCELRSKSVENVFDLI